MQFADFSLDFNENDIDKGWDLPPTPLKLTQHTPLPATPAKSRSDTEQLMFM